MKIIIIDKRHFDSVTCCNGGNYGFSTEYIQRPDGNFDVMHYTTSEFSYCHFCGSFYQGDTCPCGMEHPDVVDLKTVNREISCAMRKFAQGENWEIVIE